jgi:threonine dehydrogenase-like Zn-dependent dehydrogenase
VLAVSPTALVFDPRPARMAMPALAGRLGLDPRLPGATPMRLAEVPDPRPPAPGWALVRPRWTGVCGSDVVQAFIRVAWDNPLSAVTSFPHVPGHEVVGEVVDAGLPDPEGGAPAPETLPPGSLVAVDPWLGCEARGLAPPCGGCAAGLPPLCSRQTEPTPGGNGSGMHLGHVAGLPGGFGPLMTVHRSRLHPLPSSLVDDPGAAVLADPLAVALHAVDLLGLDAPPDQDHRGGPPTPRCADGPVLVLGAGTIGLCVTAALRRRHPAAEVLVTAAWPHLASAVRDLGAIPIPVATGAVVEQVAARCDGRARRMHPWRGTDWLAGGGVAGVIDAIGSASTVETALRVAAPRARVVTVGVHRPARTETTLAYVKELTLVGSNGYGRGPRGRHHLDEALEMLAEPGCIPHTRWRTARYPLARWREAFNVAARPGPNQSIKVTIEQGGNHR